MHFSGEWYMDKSTAYIREVEGYLLTKPWLMHFPR